MQWKFVAHFSWMVAIGILAAPAAFADKEADDLARALREGMQQAPRGADQCNNGKCRGQRHDPYQLPDDDAPAIADPDGGGGRARRPAMGPAHTTRSTKHSRGLAYSDSWSPAKNSLIQFETNSATLTQVWAARLDEALRKDQKDLASIRRLKIVGFTDAAGSRAYNRQLSLRRAQTVRDVFVSITGIPADRIVVEGRGEDGLKDRTHPLAAENRRVEWYFQMK